MLNYLYESIRRVYMKRCEERHNKFGDFFKQQIQLLNANDIVSIFNDEQFISNRLFRQNKKRLKFWHKFFKDADFIDMYQNKTTYTYCINSGLFQITIRFNEYKTINSILCVVEENDEFILFSLNITKTRNIICKKIEFKDIPKSIKNQIDDYSTEKINPMFK